MVVADVKWKARDSRCSQGKENQLQTLNYALKVKSFFTFYFTFTLPVAVPARNLYQRIKCTTVQYTG